MLLMATLKYPNTKAQHRQEKKSNFIKLAEETPTMVSLQLAPATHIMTTSAGQIAPELEHILILP